MSEHLGDALSALLDGELRPDEAVAARAHLAGCAECRAERAGVGRARSWVRGLPAVEPPAGFVDRVLASPPDEAGPARMAPAGRRRVHRKPRTLIVARRRHRAGVAAMLACAAATAGVLGFTSPRDPSGPPPVGRFIEAHATAVNGADPVSRLAPVVVPVSFRR